MSYPPPYPGGNLSYPPAHGAQGNIGFSGAAQPQQHGQSYSMYPQQGGGFPIPPEISPQYSNIGMNPPSSASSFSLPYSVNPQSYYPPNASTNIAQPLSSVPSYPSQPNAFSTPFAQQPQSTFSPPYPPQYGSSAACVPQPNAPFSQNAQPNMYSNMSVPSTNSPLNQYQAYPNANPMNTPVTNSPNVSLYGASARQDNYSTSAQQNYGSMWTYQERPTVRPGPSFDPSQDAAQLRKAMKGFGTDEALLIQILGRRTSQQRQQINQRYQQSFGRDLLKDIKSEVSGQFEVTLVALLTPLPTYLAQELNQAIVGIGTNETTLVEILCSNDNNTIRNIKVEYQRLYRKPLEADLRGDTSGDFGRLMISMAAAFREETTGDLSQATRLAQSLFQAGAKKLGTDEAEFNRILSSYSYPMLRRVFEEYRSVSGGKTFEAAIRSELSGDLREGMLAIYQCVNNRAALYARLLHEAMSGMGTKDRALVRIVVSRCEIDMGNIKDEYTKAYRRRLEDAITSDTSGDYRKILLALVQG